jgi:hypothetical protein
MIRAWPVACIREMINACRILVGKPVGKRPLKTRRTWEDNVEMDVTKMWCKDANWFHLA